MPLAVDLLLVLRLVRTMMRVIDKVEPVYQLVNFSGGGVKTNIGNAAANTEISIRSETSKG